MSPSLSDDYYTSPGYKPNGDGTYTLTMTSDETAQTEPTVLITTEVDCWDLLNDDNPNNNDGGNNSTTDCLCNSANDPSSLIRPVYIGHIRLTRQLDAWNAWNTPNKGGSELMIGRVDSKDAISQNGNSVIINSPTMEQEVYLRRREITKMKKRKDWARYNISDGYKWISMQWDSNWECNPGAYEQVLYVYEKDNTEDRKIVDANISVGLDSTTNASLNIQVTFPVFSDEDLVLVREIDHRSFFLYGLDDHGLGCRNGQHSFSSECWPIYGGGTFEYTMPFKCNN